MNYLVLGLAKAICFMADTINFFKRKNFKRRTGEENE